MIVLRGVSKQFEGKRKVTALEQVDLSIERGEMVLHGAYFGVAEGSLFVLDKATKEFRRVRDAMEAGE